MSQTETISQKMTNGQIHDGVVRKRVEKKPSRKRMILLAFLVLLGAFGAWVGIGKYRYAQNHVDTDDAQIDGHISPVIPRVAGYVTSVSVSDNEHVADGAEVATIDARELRIKVETAEAAVRTAEAALVTAKATLSNAEAALNVARASVHTAEIARNKSASDLERDRELFQQSVIAQERYESTRTAAESAASQLVTVQRQVQTAEAQIRIADAQVKTAETQVSQRVAEADYARLQLSYATITAPSSGVVSKLNVEVGQFVQAGQPLMAIAEDSVVWVTANFKETDMNEIHPGESVEVTVDAFPDAHFSGRVESVAGATGAKFSLLPPDNATGNFIKVTQRVPVKIVLDGPVDQRYQLRPGMSADVAITVTQPTEARR